jgi:ATPase family associated with various cellular activities (AAA)
MSDRWETANQAHIAGEFRKLAALLGGARHDATNDHFGNHVEFRDRAPALDHVASIFALTSFERSLLLMVAGVAIDGPFAQLCGGCATFGLALEKLPGAHWSALSPAGPLRRWRLIEPTPGRSLATTPLQIDERVLNFLLGIDHEDATVARLVYEPLPEAVLVPTHRAIAARITKFWAEHPDTPQPTAIQLCGGDPRALIDIAQAACADSGMQTRIVMSDAIPKDAESLGMFARLWEREASFVGAALVVDCTGNNQLGGDEVRVVDRLLGEVGGLVIVLSVDRRIAPARRPFYTIDVDRPSEAEQCAIWADRLNDTDGKLGPHIDNLAAQFDLGVSAIEAACRDAQLGEVPLTDALWDSCRAQSRLGMAALARRLDAVAGWDDLVVTDHARAGLESVVRQVRYRSRVYRDWGFSGRGSRGRGISALFSGPSGTGKTMAAEVIANELRLDLYAIDLSAMVSKYIGETEKNLRRVFDAAESSGAILLFDEADALFGRRSEVKDSHDRYANIEVSYLLHRIESYRGVAILTSNMKSALDVAFLRRLSVIVEFPFPDEALRIELWKRAFPPATPTQDLDPHLLAQLHVAGGSVKNIALGAAFLAAAAERPVTKEMVLTAAQVDYAKSDRHITPAELRGWS